MRSDDQSKFDEEDNKRGESKWLIFVERERETVVRWVNVRLCLVTVFFLNFLFSKTIFYFLRQKTCLVTYFRQKSKTIFNFHIVKEIENWS